MNVHSDATYAIWIEGLPSSPNQTVRRHWAANAAEKQLWQTKIGWLATANRPTQPYTKAIIHFAINVGSNRRRDPDNLNWSVTKPALDALKGVWIEDDTIDNVQLSYSYSREKPAGFTISIRGL